MSQEAGLINELGRPKDVKKNVDIIAEVKTYGLVICLCAYCHTFQSHTTIFVLLFHLLHRFVRIVPAPNAVPSSHSILTWAKT